MSARTRKGVDAILVVQASGIPRCVEDALLFIADDIDRLRNGEMAAACIREKGRTDALVEPFAQTSNELHKEIERLAERAEKAESDLEAIRQALGAVPEYYSTLEAVKRCKRERDVESESSRKFRDERDAAIKQRDAWRCALKELADTMNRLMMARPS